MDQLRDGHASGPQALPRRADFARGAGLKRARRSDAAAIASCKIRDRIPRDSLSTTGGERRGEEADAVRLFDPEARSPPHTSLPRSSLFDFLCRMAEPLPTLHYKRARFVTQLPASYLYTPGHFWLSREEARTWKIGLTKFGSRMLGEMVDYGFDTAPGAQVVPGQVIGWVEGFKAISELACVGAGKFAGANTALEQSITLVNQDPYGTGWLYALKGEPDRTCMDVRAYAKLLDQVIDKLSQGA